MQRSRHPWPFPSALTPWRQYRHFWQSRRSRRYQWSSLDTRESCLVHLWPWRDLVRRNKAMWLHSNIKPIFGIKHSCHILAVLKSVEFIQKIYNGMPFPVLNDPNLHNSLSRHESFIDSCRNLAHWYSHTPGDNTHWYSIIHIFASLPQWSQGQQYQEANLVKTQAEWVNIDCW